MRYYSTQRPVSLGTFPGGHKVKEIFNFDERTFVESIGRKAWGWIEFEDELTEKEAANYELVKEPSRKKFSMDKIKFDPNDFEGMQALMKEYGDSDSPYWGENINGEPVTISIFPDRIVVATLQENGWERTNIYHSDGTQEESYDR